MCFLPLPVDDPRRRRPDIARAVKFLRWKPVTPLHSGLALTIRHFLDADTEADAPARIDAIKNSPASEIALFNSR
jgi:UDP-glucuronate decarboxylase